MEGEGASSAVLEEQGLRTRTEAGLFRSKPWQQISACSSQNSCARGLGQGRKVLLGSQLQALLYYIFKQHLSVKPSVHLHSTAKQTKPVPDLPVWLQTTFLLTSPSQTEVVFNSLGAGGAKSLLVSFRGESIGEIDYD